MASLGIPSERLFATWRWGNFGKKFFTFNCVYEYNNILFDTLVSSEAPSAYGAATSLERQLLSRLQGCSECDGDEEKDRKLLDEVCSRTCEKIKELVLTVGTSKMETITRNMDSPADRKLLPSWMHPKTVNLQLLTKEGQLVVIEREDLPIHDKHEPFTDSEIMNMKLPRHKVSDLEVVDGLLYRSVYKVNIDGQTLIAKLAKKGKGLIMVEEIKKLTEIKSQKSAGSSITRVAELKGLICSPDGIVGILLTYIPSIGDDLGGMIQRSEEIRDRDMEGSTGSLPLVISQTRKDKWVKQITETVQELHARNIIWGGVSLRNVLIHETTDDAWVIDFSNGHPDAPYEGWVDVSLRGTKAGDLHGLQHIATELAGNGMEDGVLKSTETPGLSKL
ncbi:hypothetical protein GLAREA_04699 [Glarea lozoyensis ATCC 20868]|uniref:Protein kinase domain-containing protein n=2 Tax=Glarea lozoyensis TaxID=101852 RepID=S3DN47_GLAL2|nr:uncharacterized protein GLAREA_04699 [Glarea lozoyensis ATCC 20868]EHL01936.1 hypothetical protein M7I_1884 [Glarea lozoyensis 74030]EPE27908.1 hypothetical protein GLAREA_04699 [Glarea lozoyensis ATCC 20868]